MRVGIEFAFRDQGWLGGVNGIANLLRALSTLPDPRVQPVLIANPNTPAQLFEGLPDVEILRTCLVDAGNRLHLARRISKRAIGRDPLMERWLQSKKIDVLSHCESLGPKSAIPTIGQIADFGYKYFPKLYADAAWRRMDAGTARICDQHAVIMMPSRAVVDDYRKFFPDARAKGVYLHQIPSAPPHGAAPDSATLRRRYPIRERIFYTPNQFWVHKNHSVIIDALALLAERGKDRPCRLDRRQNGRSPPALFRRSDAPCGRKGRRGSLPCAGSHSLCGYNRADARLHGGRAILAVRGMGTDRRRGEVHGQNRHSDGHPGFSRAGAGLWRLFRFEIRIGARRRNGVRGGRLVAGGRRPPPKRD